MLNSPMWLVATVSDSMAVGLFHHRRRLHWIVPFSTSSTFQPKLAHILLFTT